MILIFTGNEQLDNELQKNVNDSRIVYYPEYILQEDKTEILITTIQDNKFDFKDFMFKVRNKNIRVILILENENVPYLKYAITLGIYDILFDPFSLEEVKQKLENPSTFSVVSQYLIDEFNNEKD